MHQSVTHGICSIEFPPGILSAGRSRVSSAEKRCNERRAKCLLYRTLIEKSPSRRYFLTYLFFSGVFLCSWAILLLGGKIENKIKISSNLSQEHCHMTIRFDRRNVTFYLKSDLRHAQRFMYFVNHGKGYVEMSTSLFNAGRDFRSMVTCQASTCKFAIHQITWMSPG